MNRNARHLAAAVLLGALTLTGCAGTQASPAASSSAMASPSMSKPMASPSMTESMPGKTMAAAGMYLGYDDYLAKMDMLANTRQVLFFHATWCPDCKATNESLMSAGVPAGLTVVKVDYDAMTDLKKKYGITQQHTFVQIDSMGGKVAMWTGTKSGEAILAKTKQL